MICLQKYAYLQINVHVLAVLITYAHTSVRKMYVNMNIPYQEMVVHSYIQNFSVPGVWVRDQLGGGPTNIIAGHHLHGHVG
jgi:hypothetical protein